MRLWHSTGGNQYRSSTTILGVLELKDACTHRGATAFFKSERARANRVVKLCGGVQCSVRSCEAFYYSFPSLDPWKSDEVGKRVCEAQGKRGRTLGCKDARPVRHALTLPPCLKQRNRGRQEARTDL